MPSPVHVSDSAVQRLAEVEIVAGLAAAQGLDLVLKPGRVTLSGGVWVEVDARSVDGSVFVEAYARQGHLKGAQLKKIGQDILKLALLRREGSHVDARAIIAFASQEACDSVRGWLRRAAEAFDVEFCVVSISSQLRDQILSAQRRQVMANVDATVADVAEDLELQTEST